MAHKDREGGRGTLTGAEFGDGDADIAELLRGAVEREQLALLALQHRQHRPRVRLEGHHRVALRQHRPEQSVAAAAAVREKVKKKKKTQWETALQTVCWEERGG